MKFRAIEAWLAKHQAPLLAGVVAFILIFGVLTAVGPAGIERFVEKLVPSVSAGQFTFNGNFNVEGANHKYSKTFISTLTCRTGSGPTTTVGGSGDPFAVARAVAAGLQSQGVAITHPTQPLVQSDGGWDKNANLHTPTLTAACAALGFDTVVSSTCRDGERSGRYPNGKCNFHSPGNNQMFRYSGTVTPAAQCANGLDDDRDGVVDAADAQCHTDGNPHNRSSYDSTIDREQGTGASCSDGRDNDRDGRIDGGDPDCHTDGDVNNPASYNPNWTEAPDCSDGADNDRDGFADAADAQCHTDGNPDNRASYDLNLDNERGTGATCSDGRDNDGDNRTDGGDVDCHTDGNVSNPNSYDPNRDENPPVQAPRVDLTINGQSGPLALPHGSDINLVWNTQRADTCVASGSWAGSRSLSGNQTISNLTGPRTYQYALTCTNAGGSITDREQVTIAALVPRPACSNTDDDDRDGAVDAADAQCHTDGNPHNRASYDPNRISEHGTGASCSDGLDNDVDGRIDGGDPDCHTDGNPNNPASYDPNEIEAPDCSDGRDNDGDGFADAADAQCHTDGNPGNHASYNPNLITERGTGGTCSDGRDNDGDHLTDGGDPNCHTDGNPNNPGSYDPDRPEHPDPVVDVRANGGDAPITVAHGGSFGLTWTTSDATNCVASGAWSGARTSSGALSIGNLQGPSTLTYRLSCVNGTTVSDAVTVNVLAPVPTPTPTPTPTATPTPTPTPAPQCSNGGDDDGDGFVDAADSGCHTDVNPDNPNSYNPNDNNENPAVGQCSDSRDNDGDGRKDGNDPECHTDGDVTNINSYNPTGIEQATPTPTPTPTTTPTPTPVPTVTPQPAPVIEIINNNVNANANVVSTGDVNVTTGSLNVTTGNTDVEVDTGNQDVEIDQDQDQTQASATGGGSSGTVAGATTSGTLDVPITAKAGAGAFSLVSTLVGGVSMATIRRKW